jgi:hypothetical protein
MPTGTVYDFPLVKIVVVMSQLHEFKSDANSIGVATDSGFGKVSEKHTDLTERLAKIGETFASYRESLMSHSKDMEVEIKDWNFAVGKVEKEYKVEVTVKLVIKPKDEKTH